MDTTRLKGKNILITGAARGMGACNAEHFAELGANVCLGDLDLDAATEMAEKINAKGNGRAIAVKMDVTKREDNANAVAATVEAFGMINVGLFNAGLNKPRFFMDIDEDNWDMIMNVNTKAMWLGMQETARQMIKQGKQDYPYKLINVGSIASRKPLVDVTVYCTSKYGCLALTHCGAIGLSEHGITVNGYAPGVVVTPLWEQLDKDLVEIGFKDREGQAYDDIVRDALQIKRVSYPDDVKGTAAFLCSSDSDYMTGQMIHIDGGWCIQ
ncbi:meso-butanediol dehydrogenase/(S,S)-butanediol dehydrogenase/diacetyl reductase [Roseinatronobacter thiooxidans]|uniref:Meso-butanediol dehydrogenase/(S,S)-butanediol dehydrogenase/diacetyl reductase n=1 Tax=Roseinatronobacter thiooxidans TaxID=121821 RepID=A0A2W7Q056_9RHOB|nr:SDR family oxidoreductase [Roseinatronobacter thiooxidans]PZX39450.1 meso-butanediol dehydrogenase/(S,S)-butanediol dehydrogenase/diacetyl reductase [Roseinatronobacter thiooxidans]